MHAFAVQMSGRTANKISALVISPTRELASQIAVEAEALGRFHNVTVQVSMGLTTLKAVLMLLTWLCCMVWFCNS